MKISLLLIIGLVLGGCAPLRYEEVIEAKKYYCERMLLEAKKLKKEPIHYDPLFYNCIK